MQWVKWAVGTVSACTLAYFASVGINDVTGCKYASYALLPSAILSGRMAAVWAQSRR